MASEVFLGGICLLLCLGTGWTLKCYSCYAKYGSKEMTTYEHGPCWDTSFEGSQLDGIYCRHECIIMRENTEIWDGRDVEWIRTYSVFRGCSPSDGCKDIPSRPGSGTRGRVSATAPPLDAACCNTTYCNGSIGQAAMNPLLLAIVAAITVSTTITGFLCRLRS